MDSRGQGVRRGDRAGAAEPPLRRLLRISRASRQAQREVPTPLRVQPNRLHRRGRGWGGDDGDRADPRCRRHDDRSDGPHLRWQSGPCGAIPLSVLRSLQSFRRNVATRAFGFGFSVPSKTVSTIDSISNFSRKYSRSSRAAIRYGPNVPHCLLEKHLRNSHPFGRRMRRTVSTYEGRFSGGRTWNTPRSRITTTRPGLSLDRKMSSTWNSICTPAVLAARFAFRMALGEMSLATTSNPLRARAIAWVAGPVPRSRTRAPPRRCFARAAAKSASRFGVYHGRLETSEVA